MSGFVGIVNLDGAPVDASLLAGMTRSMAFRGPDGCETWIDGAVGFGHCLLRIDPSADDCQPFSLDGRVWVAADAALDARADLSHALEAHGCRGAAAADDARLIAHAYAVWGEACVDHLVGDFAFTIWDSGRRTLFCGRDHLGVRPFYYAVSSGCVVVSNTLNCVRLHPRVSGKLNDRAIGDFLLFGYNQDPATTTFDDIQRLPPGHVLICSPGSIRLRRYWTLPVEHVSRRGDHVNEFRALWQTAVANRLRGDRVGVLMSGGLDSTSVAVTAHTCASLRSAAVDLSAFTLVYDRLIPDRERHYAGLVATSLGVRIHFLAGDGYRLFDRLDDPAYQTPEPSDNPLAAATADLMREVASRCRVALTGEGGDPALAGPTARDFSDLLRAGRLGRWARDVFTCLVHGQRPPLGIRSALKRWMANGPPGAPYPPWISEDFAERLELRKRWRERTDDAPSLHPGRPAAYRALTSPFWPSLFESYDAGVTLSPLQVRHPFFDIRLLTYLLTIPPVPWFVNKALLREAMRGSTPEAVRRRLKVPLASDPICALLQQPAALPLNGFEPAPELLQYVDLSKVPGIGGQPLEIERSRSAWHLVTRPLRFNYWLVHHRSVRSSRKEPVPWRNQTAWENPATNPR